MNIKTYTLLLCTLLTASCYQTSRIPQDEKLYAGIKDLAYGYRAKKDKSEGQEGIITAFADAYHTVDGLLSGNKDILRQLQGSTELTQEQKDSLLKQAQRDQQAYDLARTEVEGVLHYAPNGSLMGSSKYTHPFTVGLWIYNRYLNSDSRFGQWMCNTFGSKPIYISTVNPIVRTQIAENTLRNFGYFHGKVSYDLIPTRNPRKQRISYSVLPGQLFRLDSIAYLGFSSSADSILRSNAEERLLHSGDPFSAANLSNERQRISGLFRDNGYYHFRPEYITYRADTIQKPLHVQLQVKPQEGLPQSVSRQYHLGNTYINLFKYNDYNIIDSIGRRDIRMYYSGGKPGRPPLRYGAIRRSLYHKKGDLYSQSMQTLEQDKLSGIGVFSQVQLSYVPRDTTAACDTLDMHITAILDKPYDSEFEGKVTFKSNGQVGPGLSYSLSKRNAFRRAETLSFQVWGSYEWQTGANIQGSSAALMNSWEYGANLNLTYPRFMFFGLMKHINRDTHAQTRFRLDASVLSRSGYFSRVTVGTRVNWDIRTQPNILHEITPFHLEYSRQLSTSDAFNRIMEQNPALFVSMRDQFVPSMEYTFTWTSKAGVRNPSRLILNTKEAGNLFSAFYAIGGKGFSEENKGIGGVPFAQYFKLSLDYSYNYRLTPRQSIVMRGFAGAIWSYGNTTVAPYNDLFTVGGANSIRAFGIRTIGPGSYHPEQSQYSYINQTGNLKFEANVEYRFPIIGNLGGALFVDCGNTWLMNEDPARPGGAFSFANLGNDLALGTGAGIRYDLDFMVIRFDIGVGIHAPYDTGTSGYYNMPSFSKSLGYHLAIGYPF